MSATTTIVIYLGSFLVVAIVVKWAIGRWMNRHDLYPSDAEAQMGPGSAPRRRFLLGFWRDGRD